MYEYDGRVVKVIDGETLVLELDLGFHIFHRVRVALVGVKTPDIGSADEDEAKAAILARTFLEGLASGKSCRARVSRTGRGVSGYVAQVFVFDVDLGADLIRAGHARGRA